MSLREKIWSEVEKISERILSNKSYDGTDIKQATEAILQAVREELPEKKDCYCVPPCSEGEHQLCSECYRNQAIDEMEERLG